MEVYKDENHPTNSDVLLGIMKYNELLENAAPSYGLYMDSIAAGEKLRIWLRNFDLNERTPNGAMVLKPKDVQMSLNEVPNTIKKLEEARRLVVAEIAQNSKTRNDRETGFFEK